MIKEKENLTIVGIVLMIFGIIIFFGSIPSPTTLSSQIGFIIGPILATIGFFMVAICHSLTLSIGIALLLFGFIRIITANVLSIYFRYSYMSHYEQVGWLYICIGGPLVIFSFFEKYMRQFL